MMSERVKRFDDIFKMLLLILTIIISVGSVTFGNINLLSTLGLIILPLIFWIIGHTVGSYPNCTSSEIAFKLFAWGFESLAVPIVVLKFFLKGSILSYWIVAFCTLMSFGLTILPYVWLKELLSEPLRRTFLRDLFAFFMVIDFAVNVGIWVV